MSLILKCECTGRFIRHLDNGSFCSKCGSKAVLDFPKAVGYQQLDVDYDCPVTGKPIRSKQAHEENLKLHGAHVLEKGEDKDAKRARDAENERFENMICETAAQLVHDLPEPIKLALEQELLTTETKISRGTL